MSSTKRIRQKEFVKHNQWAKDIHIQGKLKQLVKIKIQDPQQKLVEEKIPLRKKRRDIVLSLRKLNKMLHCPQNH